jgi:hypothetical protein
MSEQYMTMAEIEKKYPQEWVLVGELKKGRTGFAIGGVVLAHGTDKEAVLGAANHLPKPVELAFYFTGPIPEDMVFLL